MTAPVMEMAKITRREKTGFPIRARQDWAGGIYERQHWKT